MEPFPDELRTLYEVHEWRNAYAVLKGVHPQEWEELVSVLLSFRLLRSEVIAKGGNKSPIAAGLNGKFAALGWREKKFDTKIVVDDAEYRSPTHSVDYFKNKIAVETEWNNKDPFYDRDLNNFRLLFDLRVVKVGIMITRCDELQMIFNALGKGASYGGSTTHMSKLLPKVEGGGAGGCPLLVFGISSRLYVED